MTGNAARLQAIAAIADYQLPDPIEFEGVSIPDLFASNVFSLSEMKARLSKTTYKSIFKTIKNGASLDPEIADEVASAMKAWAMEHGATHVGHIFYPLTNFTAEKNDAFFEPDGDGGIISEFTGANLVQQEPDGSSFPSGGIRDTHEARGYTAWDVTSPAYLVENPNGKTLTIPAAFVSWTGEATDRKTPLLRSMDAVSAQATRVLKALGNRDVAHVSSSAGAEQEYFLIDKNFYQARPDLISAGRTLFGASSPKGQEFDDHYFGAIATRVQAFMYEFERELYKLGVPVKTRHNEVAPGQYEVAPVYESSNIATDHQQIVMTQVQKVAEKYGFACLLHEKPFAGVNGSGKHLNFSLGNSTQGNLFEPGDTPHSNMQFMVFCAAAIRAVHKYAPLLRAAVASASNDHRLGANEAPPAIISIFLGDQLSDVFDQIAANGKATSSKQSSPLRIGVDSIPAMPKHAGDRNRTSPFAFTGNKFEFRAVGSLQSIAGPATVLNTIMAESLDYIADKLTGIGRSTTVRNEAVQNVLAEIIKEHGAIVFNGNGYSDEWHKEAVEERGLPNLRTTPDALPSFITEEAEALFSKYGVYSKAELHAVYEVALEQYNMTVNVESNLVQKIAQTMILPAAARYAGDLASSVIAIREAGVDADNSVLQDVVSQIDALKAGMAKVAAAKAAAPHDAQAEAVHNKDAVLPAMLDVRAAADTLEGLVADDLWPLPTYQEMLFLR